MELRYMFVDVVNERLEVPVVIFCYIGNDFGVFCILFDLKQVKLHQTIVDTQ